MRIVLGDLTSEVKIGGTDNLLSVNLLKELREYLRVRIDGYHRTEAYQEGRWDGYKYFITNKGKFNTGLFPYVVKFSKNLGAKVKVEDNRKTPVQFVEEWGDFVGVIDGVSWYANDDHPKYKRAYQLEAAKSLLKKYRVGDVIIPWNRGILDCATNAGKNSIAALIVNNLKNKQNILFTVSNKDIFKQAVDFFSQVIEEPVGEVRSGVYKPKWFTVVMVKSLYNLTKKNINSKAWLQTIDVLIVDESDEAGAKEYSSLLSMIPASLRVFMSGTPLDSKDSNNMTALGLSGPVLHTISNRDLIEKGVSQNPIINMVLNNTPMAQDIDYTREKTRGITESIYRLRRLKEIIEEHSDKQIIVSFRGIDHGYFMYNYIKSECPGVDSDIVHGKSEFRSDIVDTFQSGKINLLFSSMIFKRGINMPNIDVLVLANGGESVSVTKQYIGRSVRHDGVHDDVIVYDFYDSPQSKYLSKHSRSRMRLYKKEGFDVVYHYENKGGIPINIL